MTKIDFIYFDAGGGHRSAATALKSVIEQQGRPWEIRLVNLQEVLDPLDVFRKLTGIRLQDIYNLMLAKGWTLGRAGVSRKHALSIVNRGGATASEILAAARTIRDGVRDRLGVTLEPEPVLVGASGEDHDL